MTVQIRLFPELPWHPGTGTGILEAAKEAGKYAIGVDLNQDNDQPGHVVTSMVKRVDTACYSVIQSVVDGTFKGDTTSYLEISNDGVDLTDFAVIKEHLGDKFPGGAASCCKGRHRRFCGGCTPV